MTNYPVISTSNGTVVATCNHAHNAEMLAAKVNRVAGVQLVEVGEPVPHNPKHTEDLIADLIAVAK